MSNITLSNLKPVSEFSAFILNRVQNQNKNWWEIAQAFAEAREMYGFDSDSFRKLCVETKFSKSKASKLASIAQSERLKVYAEKLSGVHSWGTLYAITTLSEVQFQDLKQALLLDNPNAPIPFITQAEVERFKRQKTAPSFFKNYAVIQIDEEALKGGLLDGDDCEALNALIAQIEALSPYIKIRHMNLDEKEASAEMIRLKQKMDQIAHRTFYNHVSSKLSQINKMKGEKPEIHEVRALGITRHELMYKFRNTPKEAFEYMGLEYDEARFFNEAQSVCSQRAERYAQKVLDRLASITKPEVEVAEAA